MFKLFSSKGDSVIDSIYQISNDQLLMLDRHKSLTNNGKFEVLIFCAFVILQSKNFEPEIKSKYLRHLVNIRKSYGVNAISNSIVDLINNRMQFYSLELKKLLNSREYINGSIYNVFYEAPLSLKPKHSDDLPEILKFSLPFTQIVKNLMK